MASVVIEFDAAHLQANKSAVRQNPDSTVQLYWYFTGCIIKLNNPFWMEAKWWNSSQWPQPNHKQKGILMLLRFQSVSWLPRCLINCWTWNLSLGRWRRYRFFLNIWAHSRFTDLCFDCRGSLRQQFWCFVATIGKYLKPSSHQLLKSDVHPIKWCKQPFKSSFKPFLLKYI